ncbi:hypothetical protein VTK73DRAFT_952 [Phialemonium thermophilum]|uniref:ATP-dependent DNA helicase II subunit 2 n=1 Tax=Phialemonium thermophilum TaxID=223376 RepID=A0ABR3XCU3_9PEZI
MADKEATVYIIDLGKSMGKANNGRSESDLDWSMRYVWDRISTTVAASRKTWTVGVIGLRTDLTDNNEDAAGLDGYENISVLQQIGPLSMTSLKELRPRIAPSNTNNGDAISAIVVAVGMIDSFTKKLKYNRRIVLVTDGKGPMDDDSLEDVSQKLNESNIELTVIGVDFDDPEYGFKEEEKSKLKAKNEKILARLVSQCKDGIYGTMAQAVEELSMPRIKQVRPFKSYDGPLTLGDPEKYPSAMSISVERYFKTKLAHPPSATTVIIKSEHGAGPSQVDEEADEMEGVERSGPSFAGVKQVRTYKVEDPDAPGGKRDVEFESLAKGYEYGRTVVPISESDWNITKLETKKSFTILGFIPFSSYEPFLNMGEAGIIIAQKFNERAELALSSFVNALYELESYAIARYVAKDGQNPLLVLLIPSPKLESETECLYDIPLPFAEDVRSYQFPPLDKVITANGPVTSNHRLLPDENLQKAMSDYVDAMDLSGFAVDDEGKPSEYAPLDESYNPIIHRINQAIRQRAVHPERPIEPAAGILLRYSKPPEDLVAQAKTQIEALIKHSDVKKVPPKAKGKRKRETIKPISGLDVDALLGQKKKIKITMENAVPEFKQMLASAEQISTIENATKQMGGIVLNLIRASSGSSNYDRAAENIRVMREELISLEEPELYNKFLRDLKDKLFKGDLGGDRRDLWRQKIVGLGLNLITQQESEASEVTEADAKKFEK